MTRNWPVLMEEWTRSTLRDPLQHLARRPTRDCPCCGHKGYFVSAKRRKGLEMRCPNCSSRPRDRFLALVFDEAGINLAGQRIMHFAPEWPLFRKLKNQPGYVGGDIIKRRNANAVVDITRIESADEDFDIVICNHVLEHVPDHMQAIRECHRILRPDGLAFFSVPVDKTKEKTWYPPSDMPVEEVDRMCGWDHKRTYGCDFKDILASVGFHVTVIDPRPDWVHKYRLYDEQFFVCSRTPARFVWDGATHSI